MQLLQQFAGAFGVAHLSEQFCQACDQIDVFFRGITVDHTQKVFQSIKGCLHIAIAVKNLFNRRSSGGNVLLGGPLSIGK
ncbi:hypothetical protein D3C76_1789390 [compost metagenome]